MVYEESRKWVGVPVPDFCSAGAERMTLWPAALRLLNRVRRFISAHPSSLDCTMRTAEARGKEVAKNRTWNERPEDMDDSKDRANISVYACPSLTAPGSYSLSWFAHCSSSIVSAAWRALRERSMKGFLRHLAKCARGRGAIDQINRLGWL
jgi:hypothetical protein